MFHPRALVSTLLCALLVSLAPAATAGTAASPEIEDPRGDVDPASLAGIKPEELEAVSTNLSMYDIVAAYVTGESRTTFHLAVQLADLDPGIESPDPSVPRPALPAYGTYDLHFRTSGGLFLARAQLDLYVSDQPPGNPPPGEPPVPPAPPPLPAVPYVNFSLHRDAGEPGEETFLASLAGYPLVAADTIWFAIPKELVGAPEDGTLLDQFWAETGHRGAPLDRAPDLVVVPTGGGLPSLDPTQPGLPASYGDAYTFGQYPLGAVQSLRLAAQGITEGDALPGEALTFHFRIENQGARSEEVLFMARAPRGWAATFDEPRIDLGPGSSRILGVTVVPGEDASRTGLFLVKATSIATGQTHEVGYSIRLAGAGSGGSGDDGAPTGVPQQSNGSSGDDKDSPGLGFVAALVAAGAVVVAIRRRR